MNVSEGLTNPSWLIFALIFMGVIVYLAYMRQKETRRINKKFDIKDIILTSFGVNYYGLDSEPGGPLRSAGALVLLKDGIYYRARFANRELLIPASSIIYIGVTDTHKNKPLHQSVVAIRFLNKDGKEEKAAFRIPYPAQWVSAIKANLTGNNQKIRESD